MKSLLRSLATTIGFKPNWKVRLLRGDTLIVTLNQDFRLGTIEGGHDMAVSLVRHGASWREKVRGYNGGVGEVIEFEGESAANPNEGTLSIFGAVFRFTDDGVVLYQQDDEIQRVGHLTLPS